MPGEGERGSIRRSERRRSRRLLASREKANGRRRPGTTWARGRRVSARAAVAARRQVCVRARGACADRSCAWPRACHDARLLALDSMAARGFDRFIRSRRRRAPGKEAPLSAATTGRWGGFGRWRGFRLVGRRLQRGHTDEVRRGRRSRPAGASPTAVRGLRSPVRGRRRRDPRRSAAASSRHWRGRTAPSTAPACSPTAWERSAR